MAATSQRQRSTQHAHCENCSESFHIFRRRFACLRCSRSFCSKCLRKLHNPLGKSVRLCSCCFVLNGTQPDRVAIGNLRIRDLVWFLESKGIDARRCCEKRELVDLVVDYFKDEEADAMEEGVWSSSSSSNGEESSGEMEVPNPGPSENRTQFESGSSVLHQEGELIISAAMRLFEGIFGMEDQDQSAAATGDQSQTRAGPGADPEVVVENSDDTDDDVSHISYSSSSSDSSGLSARGARQNDTPSHQTDRIDLGSITSESQLDNLSVRQLKLILMSHLVDYSGCCEKFELSNKVKQLWRSRVHGRADAEEMAVGDADLCKICMDAVVDCVLLECGHMVCCTQCGRLLNECPICRQYVSRAVHTYRS